MTLEFFSCLLAPVRREGRNHLISTRIKHSWDCPFSLDWFGSRILFSACILIVLACFFVISSFFILCCCAGLSLDDSLKLISSLDLAVTAFFICSSNHFWLFCQSLRLAHFSPYRRFIRFQIYFWIQSHLFGPYCQFLRLISLSIFRWPRFQSIDSRRLSPGCHISALRSFCSFFVNNTCVLLGLSTLNLETVLNHCRVCAIFVFGAPTAVTTMLRLFRLRHARITAWF